MYIHALTFTKDDRERLHQLYETLMIHLERGKELRPQYFIDLKLSMQRLLYRQKGLHDFWAAVKQEPEKMHHLHLTHASKALLNLPWQIAIDTTLHPSVCISKGAPESAAYTDYIPQAGPLRILVMISSPEDLDHTMRLSYEEEEQVILQVLGPLWETGEVQVDFLEDGSLQGLQDRLQQQHYHVLYFSGHGVYERNEGFLKLENTATLATEYTSAAQFSKAVHATPAHIPSLIILSSCQTAQGDMKEGFRGIADELMHTGVPTVIAMAFKITDHYAVSFAAHLYKHLAHRKPLIEAYANALSAMKEEEQQQLVLADQHQYYPSQWLVPQLYCSRRVEHIVDWQAPGQVWNVANAPLIKGEALLLLSPRKDYYFIGRRRENALLFSKLVQHLPVLLRGQGGVGKTAMAEHLAKRLISQSPDRYCFAFNETNIGVDGMVAGLRQYLEKEGHLSAIALEMDKSDAVVSQLDLLLKQVAQVCQPVWIFDNLESCQQDIDGPLKETYREWMHYVQTRLLYQFPVIFTGRYPIQELPDIIDISLNEAPLVDYYRKCLQLHIRTLGSQSGLPDFFKTVTLLYQMLGGSYRILEFLDELYKNDRAKVMAVIREMHALQKEQPLADELMQEIHQKVANGAKRIVFSALLGILSEQERATFHLLLYFRRPVLVQALNRQLPDKDFGGDLKRLQHLTLVEEHIQPPHTFYYITPLVRDWTEGIALPVVEFYPEYAGDYFEYAFNEVTCTYYDIEEAFHYYTHSHKIDKINNAGVEIMSKYYRVGLFDLVLYYGRKVELIAGVRTHEEVLNNLGLTYLKYARFDQALAYLTKFMIAARRSGDKIREASALNSISQVYYQQKNFDTALVWLEKSRLLSKENKLGENEAVSLTNIGSIYIDRKQYALALDVLKRSLQIRRTTGNHRGEIRVLMNISSAYVQQEEYEKAIQSLQKALTVAVAAEEKLLEGSILTHIGIAYDRMGAFDKALPYLTKGLAIGQQLADQEGIGTALMALGLVHKMLGNFNEAIECLTRGVLILQKFGYGDMDANISWHLGNIYVTRGDYEEGILLLLESLPVVRAGEDRLLEMEVLDNLAEACMALRHFDQALIYLQESILIKQALGDAVGECIALNSMGQIYTAREELDSAVKCLRKVLAIQKAQGDTGGQALAHFNLAFLYADKGDEDRFLRHATTAYTLHAKRLHLEGMYYSGLQIGLYLCMSDKVDMMQDGILFLEQTYEIGIQSDYPDVEELAGNIQRFTKRYHKKTKKKARI